MKTYREDRRDRLGVRPKRPARGASPASHAGRGDPQPADTRKVWDPERSNHTEKNTTGADERPGSKRWRAAARVRRGRGTGGQSGAKGRSRGVEANTRTARAGSGRLRADLARRWALRLYGALRVQRVKTPGH